MQSKIFFFGNLGLPQELGAMERLLHRECDLLFSEMNLIPPTLAGLQDLPDAVDDSNGLKFFTRRREYVWDVWDSLDACSLFFLFMSDKSDLSDVSD